MYASSLYPLHLSIIFPKFLLVDDEHMRMSSCKTCLITTIACSSLEGERVGGRESRRRDVLGLERCVIAAIRLDKSFFALWKRGGD